MSYDVAPYWQDLRNRFRRDEDDVRGVIDAEFVWKTMIFLQLRFPLVWEAPLCPGADLTPCSALGDCRNTFNIPGLSISEAAR